MLILGDLALPFVLQRLTDLQASTASAATKMQEAQNLCDEMAVKMLEPDARNKSITKLSGTQSSNKIVVASLAGSMPCCI